MWSSNETSHGEQAVMVVSAVIAGATEENVIVSLFSYRMMVEK